MQLQATKADQMGARLVDMCTKLGQIFFPSVTEQGRGNEMHSGYTHAPKPQPACSGGAQA